jgi:hypothetical protein
MRYYCALKVQHDSYDLQLSWRLCIIKSSRATSRVKWLNGEKPNVSRTISVLVLRVLSPVRGSGKYIQSVPKRYIHIIIRNINLVCIHLFGTPCI